MWLNRELTLKVLNTDNRTSQVASVVKNPPTRAGDSGDSGSILESGRSPGEVNGNLLPWWATVHGVAKSQKHLSD